MFCVVTPSHQELFDQFFLPSLDTKLFELVSYQLAQEGTGEFLGDDFVRCIQFKLTKILESIEQNENELIVWSDVDIQFFGLKPEHITKYFQNEEDLVAQRLTLTGNHACGGFYALRCSAKTHGFFVAVDKVTIELTRGNEQEAINLLLQQDSSLRWNLFGPEFYARSQGVRIPPNALLHHATNVTPGDAILKKARALTELRGFDKWNPTRKQLYVLAHQVPALIRKLTF